MRLTELWLQLRAQQVNPKKSLALHVRQPSSTIQKHTVLQAVPLPRQTNFRSLGVGIRTGQTTGTWPLLKKRIARGAHPLTRVRGAQGGFTRRTHIIAILIQSAALWGSPGADITAKTSAVWNRQCSTACGAPHDRGEQRKLYLSYLWRAVGSRDLAVYESRIRSSVLALLGCPITGLPASGGPINPGGEAISGAAHSQRTSAEGPA